MVHTLKLENFRVFPSVSLRFDSESVVFCGSNGQGKTTLLEALFYLANLRSFRTARALEMVRLGTARASLSTSVSFSGWEKRLDVELGETRRLRIDGEAISRASSFAGAFHAVTFLPDDPEIVTGRSMVRRKFIDMFVSILDRGYFLALQQYGSALKNRNFLLRSKTLEPDLIKSYHPVMAASGSEIVRKRSLHLRVLSDYMRDLLLRLRPELSDFQIKTRFPRETEREDAFRDRLDQSVTKDAIRGFTSFGPHLDDFDFIADDKPLRLYGSRGQCRTVSFALKMSEFDIVRNHSMSKDNTIVLIDDATGDLDSKAKEAFFEKIAEAKQVFSTCTDLTNLPFRSDSQIVDVSSGCAVVRS